MSCRTNKRIKDSRRKFREPGAGWWGWHEQELWNCEKTSSVIDEQHRSSSWTLFERSSRAWGTAACVQFNWKLFSHELNSAEHVGRLTPSTQSVERTKKRFLFIFKPRAWQQKLFRCNEECDRATYARLAAIIRAWRQNVPARESSVLNALPTMEINIARILTETFFSSPWLTELLTRLCVSPENHSRRRLGLAGKQRRSGPRIDLFSTPALLCRLSAKHFVKTKNVCIADKWKCRLTDVNTAECCRGPGLHSPQHGELFVKPERSHFPRKISRVWSQSVEQIEFEATCHSHTTVGWLIGTYTRSAKAIAVSVLSLRTRSVAQIAIMSLSS